MTDLAYVNGQFLPAENAVISINDRGLQFGDSVYEVIKAYGDKPVLMKEHILRLERSAKALGISLEGVVEEIDRLVPEGLKQTAFPQTIIYIQLTRGTQPRNLIVDKTIKPNLIATFRPYGLDLTSMRSNGIKVSLYPDIRWGHCDLKTTNLLGNVLMKNKANDEGCFEAILYTDDGRVSEACSSSVFVVKNGVLLTTPASENILPGVNRKYVIDTVAPQLGIPVREEHTLKDDLFTADEVFLTSTTFLVMPVIEVAGQQIANGEPGSVTMSLVKQFEKNICS